MANDALRNLTSATLAADSAIPVQNTSAATRLQQAPFSEMGGLVLASNSLTTANLTASVGTLHQLTIAGLTAIRDFILPDTAAVGERVALYIVDGDPTYEVNIKTAATGSLLNGVDHSATAWSKVFIQHETMVFRCIKAGGAGDTDWIVEHDGRIPCIFSGKGPNTSLTTTATFTVLDTVDTVNLDNASLHDATNKRVLIRRAGNYLGGATLIFRSVSSGHTVACSLSKNGGGVSYLGSGQEIVDGGDFKLAFAGAEDFAVGDYISARYYKSDSTNRYIAVDQMYLKEVLP